jgi:hypothetical protein
MVSICKSLEYQEFPKSQGPAQSFFNGNKAQGIGSAVPHLAIRFVSNIK